MCSSDLEGDQRGDDCARTRAENKIEPLIEGAVDHGLDLSQHSESGYSGLGGGSIAEGMHGVHSGVHIVAAQQQHA